MLEGQENLGSKEIKEILKKSYMQTNAELWNAEFDTNLSGN